MSECKKCIDRRMRELEEKLFRYSESLMSMFWRKELEALQNRRAITITNPDCCK